jgi:type IV pilus assembly protein PilB
MLDDFSDINSQVELENKKKEEEKGEGKEELIREDSPITKMVASIIKHAVQNGISDIHIDHVGEYIKVRFRIDGDLETYLEIPKSAHSAIVARIKIMTKTMKLDERRKPQDGRFQAIIDGRKIAFRVSIMPTFYGEKVVIRILDSAKGIRKLSKLGLTEQQEEMIRYAIERPHGLILITGPTGSGKTTTLYSMLGEVDREKKNVVSLEDPIEYQFPGVNQSQVRADIGYTFASGLRSIVRQDPDVIMVGEIRDKETAGLAIQAALTGHLVFATLHTNSSFGIIPRLVEMGVDPYLIAPTLILGIAQRLLKKIAPGAAVPLEEKESIQKMIDDQFADLPDEYKSKLNLKRELYDVKPTKDAPTGMKGREAILEMFRVDKEIEKIILDNPTELAIYESARKKGMLTLKEAAILKGMDGIVPFKEINDL